MMKREKWEVDKKNNCQNDTCPPVTVVDAKLGDKNDLSVPNMII